MAAQKIKLIAASLLLSLSAVVYPQTKPTAREIIKAMVGQYKKISSYQDAGEVTVAQAEPRIARLRNVSFQQRPLPSNSMVSFRTYFTRPDILRFDWKPTE